MHFILRPQARSATMFAGLLLAAATTLAACAGPSSHTAAASGGTIAPGAGQSLAGMPGATGTGTVAPVGGVQASPSMTMIMTAPAGTGPVTPVSSNAVAIKNFAFAPAALIVKVGTTVTWTNQDTDDHTVTSQGSGGPLKSVALGTGQTFSYTFTKAGTYSYYCTIHPFMTATVTVTQ